MRTRSNHIYEFGPFRLDVSERLLMKHEQSVALPPKAFEMLTVLVRKKGRLIEKDELLKEVWPDSFVEESSLSHNIYLLRKALGEGSDEVPYIETVPRRGYRFIADVKEIVSDDAAPALEQTAHACLLIKEDVPEVEEEDCEADSARHTSPPTANRSWPSRYTYLLASLALILTVAAFWMKAVWQRQRDTDSNVRSIAVLPFKPLGEDKSNELLGLGMADALIIKLSELNRISVLPTSAIFKYTGREIDSLAVGRELDVDAVMDGTVQREDGRVRVTAQLIRLSDGKTLWSGKFDEQFNNIFAVQDSLSEQLAGALSIRLEKDERERLAKRFTQSTEAYQAYLWGVYHWNRRTNEGLHKAAEFFQKATEIDPNYALAYAELADTYCLIRYYRYGSQSSEEVYQKAKRAATDALARDAMLAEAHSAMGCVNIQFENDRDGAAREYRRAIELNPNLPVVHLRYAWTLVSMGDIDGAVQQAKRAQQLDPLSFVNNLALGQILIYARSPDEASNYFQITQQIEPTLPGVFSGAVISGLGDAYLLKGRHEEAIAKFQELEKVEGGRINALGMLGYTYAVSGRRVEAQKILTQLQELAPSENSLYYITGIYGALNQKEQAFQWLDKAIKANQARRRDLRYDYKLDALRDDKRFGELIRQHQME